MSPSTPQNLRVGGSEMLTEIPDHSLDRGGIAEPVTTVQVPAYHGHCRSSTFRNGDVLHGAHQAELPQYRTDEGRPVQGRPAGVFPGLHRTDVIRQGRPVGPNHPGRLAC